MIKTECVNEELLERSATPFDIAPKGQRLGQRALVKKFAYCLSNHRKMLVELVV